MKLFKKICSGIFVFFAFLVLILPFKTLAQQSGIEISPVTYNFELKPGSAQKAIVTVTNLNNTDLNYVMEAEDFSQVSDEGAPSFSGQNSNPEVTSLKDWITFDSSTQQGTISPKKDVSVGFTISIPTGAEPGGHYAAVFAKEVKKNPEGQTEIAVASRVGTLILVSVPGNVSKSAEITQYQTPKFVWKGPVDFSMKVKNTGSVHYDSQGTVSIKPILGATTSVDLGKHTIIPQNSRNYQGEWSKRFPFGYYQLTFTAIDGNGQPITTTATLWAIPLEIVIPVIVGLILIILIVAYVRKHYRVVRQ